MLPRDVVNKIPRQKLENTFPRYLTTVWQAGVVAGRNLGLLAARSFYKVASESS